MAKSEEGRSGKREEGERKKNSRFPLPRHTPKEQHIIYWSAFKGKDGRVRGGEGAFAACAVSSFCPLAPHYSFLTDGWTPLLAISFQLSYQNCFSCTTKIIKPSSA